MNDIDRKSLVALVAQTFNIKYPNIGITLHAHASYANDGTFMGRGGVYPSIDISLRSKVDASIFFRDPDACARVIATVHDAAITRFSGDRVFRKSRRHGEAVAVSFPTSEFLTPNPETAKGIADLLADLVGIAQPLFPVVKSPVKSARNPAWSRDELILALELYAKSPHSLPGPAAESVIRLSQTLNLLHARLGTPASTTLRNPNGVSMKLQNFRRFEPPAEDGQAAGGLKAGNRLEEEVWGIFRHDYRRLQSVAHAIREQIEAEIGDGFGKGAEAVLAGVEEASEGRVLTVTHLRRERSRQLVQSKKDRALRKVGRLACEACNFDFQDVYGDRGSGFIECHHTKPVETLLEDATTRLEDLALLCSNCHRMIHAMRPWLGVKELQEIIKRPRRKEG